MQHLLAAMAGEHLIHRLAEVLAAVEYQSVDLLLRRLGAQLAQGTAVVGEHMALPVQQKEALGHILRQGGKFLLLLAQLAHLLLDGVVLMLDAEEQGGQLLIGVAVLRVLQVQIDNGPDDPLGHPGCQHRREQQGQGQDDQNGLDHR